MEDEDLQWCLEDLKQELQMSSKYSAAKIGQYAPNNYTQTLMNMKKSDVPDPEKLKSDETTGRTVIIEK